MVVPVRMTPLLGGWRLGILLSAIWALLVLAINLGVTIWAYTTTKPHTRTRRMVYQGSCSQVRTIDVIAHLVINALSTILLGASNYSMQCLSAPSREEVDKAHAARKWMDIGIPSLRNLRSISRMRVGLWLALSFSSLPLHLVYNSALFSSFSASQYVVLSATEQFTVVNTTLNTMEPFPWIKLRRGLGRQWMDFTSDQLRAKANTGQLQRLENSDCVRAYAQPFQSALSNLVLVMENTTQTPKYNDVLDFHVPDSSAVDACGLRQAFYWICESVPDPKPRCSPCEEQVPEILETASVEWVVWGNRVSYCLSEPAPDQCKLFFSTATAVMINVISFFKLVCIVLVYWAIRDTPLLTVGDAVASYMECPDRTTEGLGAVGRTDFEYRVNAIVVKPGWPDLGQPPKGYEEMRKRWLEAVGKHQIYLCLLSTLIGLLIWSIRALQGSQSVKTVWDIGFGVVDNRTLITGGLSDYIARYHPHLSILVSTIVANSPQPIISAAYLIYNRLATLMAMAGEWDRFAVGLRVSASKPVGAQRNSHFLELPYRFGAPIMILSGLLHWMASQALFVVDIEYYVPDGVLMPAGFVTLCGYSPLPILCLVFLGLIMVFFLIGLSMKRFRTGIPVAANCSAAISAACHYTAGSSSGISLRPLQWGLVVRDNGQGSFAFSPSENYIAEASPVLGYYFELSIFRAVQ
ncbi:hypothetical protein OQA88_7214 [Cercophora sp. LCS_1]